MAGISSATVRFALAQVLLDELRALDLPSPGTCFADAVRIGTTKIDADVLADVTHDRLAQEGVSLPVHVDAALICDLFPEAWNEAVRLSGVVPDLLDWGDNSARAADCTFLLGYLAAVKAVPECEDEASVS